MLLLISALIIAAAVACAAVLVSREIGAVREAAVRGRTLQILTVFAPGLRAVDDDPRALLVWQGLARTARQLFPDEFAALDRAAGARFPFGSEQIETAHARWTTDWLAWERAHDAEYKVKSQTVESEAAAAGATALARSRVEAVEREKLERYQRRYEEYVRVAKALKALE